MEFLAWIDRHDGVKKINIEKGNAALDGMGHGHTVHSLQVHVVQAGKQSDTLLMEECRIIDAAEIEIACEGLVGALSRKHHFDVV